MMHQQQRMTYHQFEHFQRQMMLSTSRSRRMMTGLLFKSWGELERQLENIKVGSMSKPLIVPQILKIIDISKVEWRHNNDGTEHVNIVLIPHSSQNDPDCLKAKHEELTKLKQYNTYNEVSDHGQFRISTTWVLWYKSDTIRARLVARGYEEQCTVRTDSPTITKSGLRTFLAISVNMHWNVKTTDIKFAFLQGKPLSRDVFVQPPKEVMVPKGRIWLNDAARQFY